MNLAEITAWSEPNAYLAVTMVLAVVWAAENYLVQASLFETPPITNHPRYYQAMRFGINLVVALLVVMVFSRYGLVILCIANFVLSLVVIAHSKYFHRAFSAMNAVKHVREGFQTLSFGIQIIPPTAWTGLLCALGFKMVLIFNISPEPALVPANGAIVCLLMVAMFGMLVVLQFTSFEFNSIRITSMTRAVFAYGYLNSWIAEFFLAPDTSAIARQLAELQKVSPDRLRGTEPAWPVGDKIAIVQLESFGWNTLNYRLNGREVTPFFNKLARSSRIFRLQAYHNIGTAEMDYAVLSCGTPSPQMISYFVPDVDYSNALPRFMSKRGFETVSLHGATGEFYSRRGNFERMGFNEIHFREDFRGRDVKQSYWGVRDEELFRHSAERMRNNASPQFHFIITLDTHGPFNLIKEEEKTVFPDSTMLEENYFNSLAAVDEKIREYVESLPEGTTLIFYGDHTAGVVYGDYAPARVGEAEFVPCLVHVTGSDASWMSTAPREDSQPDDLRILDIVNHLRRQVERNVPVGSGQSKVASLS